MKKYLFIIILLISLVAFAQESKIKWKMIHGDYATYTEPIQIDSGMIIRETLDIGNNVVYQTYRNAKMPDRLEHKVTFSNIIITTLLALVGMVGILILLIIIVYLFKTLIYIVKV